MSRDCVHHRRRSGCGLGLHGGRPSAGVCARCDRRVSLTLAGAAIEPAAPRRSRVASYLLAETSLLVEGPVSPEVATCRAGCCADCPDRLVVDGQAYCASCRCGRWRRARLSIRLRMPRASCPRRRWAESPGIGREHLDAGLLGELAAVGGALVRRLIDRLAFRPAPAPAPATEGAP